MSDVSLQQIEAAKDAVSHPSHYTSGGIECKDAMAAMMGTAIACALRQRRQGREPRAHRSLLVGLRVQVPMALDSQERRSRPEKVQAVH